MSASGFRMSGKRERRASNDVIWCFKVLEFSIYIANSFSSIQLI